MRTGLSPATIAARRQASLQLEKLRPAREGETVAFLPGLCLLPGALALLRGRNGSGKSTLLRRIAGLCRASEDGSVRYEGLDEEDAAEHMVYLGHRQALLPHHTVERHLRYWAALPGGSSEAVESALRFWGLEPFREYRVGALSAGWKQRAALARVMVCGGRPVWLLDEPTAALDSAGKALVMRAVSGRCYTGGIVIMSVHEEPDALLTEAYVPAVTLNMDDFST